MVPEKLKENWPFWNEDDINISGYIFKPEVTNYHSMRKDTLIFALNQGDIDIEGLMEVSLFNSHGTSWQ